MKLNENAAKFIPWLIVKLEQLADLDIPLKSPELDKTSTQIFYIDKFLAEKFNEKKDTTEEYDAQFKVYVDQREQEYPRVRFDLKNSSNDFHPLVKSRPTIREKLCRRINKLESETEFIITVFEKRRFGNERTYEKRINLRGKEIQRIQRFEFDPNGQFIQLEFAVSANESHIKKSSRSLNISIIDNTDNQAEIIFNLIFPINAQYKDPLLVKPGSKFVGFQDKYFYALDKVLKTTTLKENELDQNEIFD